jgi:hypothetical protein
MEAITSESRIIYTATVGDYEPVWPILRPRLGWRYILFSDEKFIPTVGWEIWPIPPACAELNLSPTKIARFIKLNSHKVLPGAAITIWMDASVRISCDLDFFLTRYLAPTAFLAIGIHPDRETPAQEVDACLMHRKDAPEAILLEHHRNVAAGVAWTTGLVQSGILIRRMGCPEMVRFFEAWWAAVHDGSERDQLSFNRVAKEHPFAVARMPSTIFDFFPQTPYPLRNFYRMRIAPVLKSLFIGDIALKLFYRKKCQ